MNNDISDFHIILGVKTDSNGGLLIGGGIAFEYFTDNNCGLLSFLVVSKKARGSGMASTLVTSAVERLERNAKERGNLPGCNAIFLETNSAAKITPQQDVMDPRVRHLIYHKIGFRMLEFDYVMPPITSNSRKLDCLLLTVYMTPHIPKMPLDSNKYYLPNSTLKNFLHKYYKNSYLLGRLKHKPEEDNDFQRMMHQLDVRYQIPLLDLPWEEKPWTYVDLYEDYDEDLLKKFYNELMVPNYPPDGM